MTLLELLTDTLIEINVADPGEDPEPQHIEFAGFRLNTMIESYAAEQLTMYRLQRRGPFNLVASTATYTIGSGATWDTARPIYIENAGLVNNTVSPTTETPLDIFTDDEWAAISVKLTTSARPYAIWYDHTFTTGWGTINVYPVPTETLQVVLYSPVALTGFTIPSDLGTTFSFPPAYREFLITQLARRLAGPFGKTLSPVTVKLMEDAMERVKISNLKMNELKLPAPLFMERYNIFTDRGR